MNVFYYISLYKLYNNSFSLFLVITIIHWYKTPVNKKSKITIYIIRKNNRAVLKIAKELEIGIFKIGVRLAFERSEFEAKFINFAASSAAVLRKQIKKRKTGAKGFNTKVDAVFAYVELSLESDRKLNKQDLLNYLNAFDPALFGYLDERQLEQFSQTRGLRNRGASNKLVLSAKNVIGPAWGIEVKLP